MNDICNALKLFRDGELLAFNELITPQSSGNSRQLFLHLHFLQLISNFQIQELHSKKGVKNIGINYLLLSKQIKLHFLYRKQLCQFSVENNSLLYKPVHKFSFFFVIILK